MIPIHVIRLNLVLYCSFKKSFLEVLDKHAPKKMKIFCGNHKPHVNKTLHSAVMKCSQLRHKAMKSKSKNDVIKYKKQHNLVFKLKKHCKNIFFDNLETKNNSKLFWSTSKSNFLINMQRVMRVFSLLKIIKFYLIIVK